MKHCPFCNSIDIDFTGYDFAKQTIGQCKRCKKIIRFLSLNEYENNIYISDDVIKKSNISVLKLINLQESLLHAKNLNLLYLILEERNRQDQKYGPQSHNPEVWQSIMAEEFGEMAQAINETIFNNGEEKRKLGGIENIKKELIHILAVGFAMYIDLEGKNKGGNL